MYLISTDIFYVHSFPLNFVESFQNAQIFKTGLFMKIFFTSAKDNQIKTISLQELNPSIKHIISYFITG